MSNIKIIYYNSGAIDVSHFENKVKSLCKSICNVKSGLLLVNYNGSAKELFDKINIEDNQIEILVVDVESQADPLPYWGYMNRSIWDWFSQNREN